MEAVKRNNIHEDTMNKFISAVKLHDETIIVLNLKNNCRQFYDEQDLQSCHDRTTSNGLGDFLAPTLFVMAPGC